MPCNVGQQAHRTQVVLGMKGHLNQSLDSFRYIHLIHPPWCPYYFFYAFFATRKKKDPTCDLDLSNNVEKNLALNFFPFTFQLNYEEEKKFKLPILGNLLQIDDAEKIK